MRDINEFRIIDGNYFINTGSPHYVKFVSDIENFAVYEKGNQIRNSEHFKKEGINVNFVEKLDAQKLFVRTYERGVEDETYSCGTGVTACALVTMAQENSQEIQVKVLGGILKVYAEKDGNGFKNIWLEGPAQQVYQGEIIL